MEKIDRLGWAAGMCFVSHGARIGIRVNDATLLERISSYLPPRSKALTLASVDSLFSLYVGGESKQPSVRLYNLLYAGSARVARTMDLDPIFDTLESMLHFAVAAGARHRIFIHAGVVGWRDQAIVIPGRSMSGKTTLVSELVRAGAIYYSDEFAVFDSHGRVHPYARPLKVREEGKERQKRYSVEALGGIAGIKPLRVKSVVLTAFKSGTKWCPRVLTPGQALLGLMEHTVIVRLRPETALRFLKPVALSATVVMGERGEAREVAELLLNSDGMNNVSGIT